MKDFKNMKDIDFDRLFSEAADQSVPDFEESSWDKMAALLDETEAPKGLGWKKPLIYSGIVLLLLFITYLGFNGWGKNDLSTIEAETIISSSSEVSAKKESIDEKEVTDLGSNKGLSTLKEISIGKKGTGNSNLNRKSKLLEGDDRKPSETSKFSSIEPKKRVFAKSQIEDYSERKIGDKAITKTEQIKTPSSLESKEGVPEGHSQKESIVNELKPNRQERTATIEHQPGKDEDFSGVPNYEEWQKNQLAFKNAANSLKKIDLKSFKLYAPSFASMTITAPEKSHKEAVEAETIEKGFGLRLAFSPDFSVVPENSFFKIGHNWAALLEYRFNNKWSIQTGVIKSLKYYQASPAEYKWPEAWGEAPVELNEIDARCSMIDIPLNVRYDFMVSRNRWFAQAGITSYLMLKENYEYVFASNYNDQVWKSWEGKTGFYPAGVINISGGVEKQIFRKMAVQIEPFFKIPVGKVGYGKVKLATAGLFISTKLPLNN